MTKPKAPGYQRRNYFIDKSFQTKFISKFCLLIAAGGVLTIGLLYVSALQSTTVAIMNSRVVVKTTADFILPVLVQTVLVVLIFVSLATVVVTLFVSHKIAGPLFRIKKVMETLGEGDFSSGFKIRQLDQLQEMETIFNKMIQQVRVKLKVIQDEAVSLKKNINDIPDEAVRDDKKKAFDELKKTLDEFDKSLHYFKT